MQTIPLISIALFTKLTAEQLNFYFFMINSPHSTDGGINEKIFSNIIVSNFTHLLSR